MEFKGRTSGQQKRVLFQAERQVIMTGQEKYKQGFAVDITSNSTNVNVVNRDEYILYNCIIEIINLKK